MDYLQRAVEWWTLCVACIRASGSKSINIRFVGQGNLVLQLILWHREYTFNKHQFDYWIDLYHIPVTCSTNQWACDQSVLKPQPMKTQSARTSTKNRVYCGLKEGFETFFQTDENGLVEHHKSRHDQTQRASSCQSLTSPLNMSMLDFFNFPSVRFAFFLHSNFQCHQHLIFLIWISFTGHFSLYISISANYPHQ